MGSRGGTMGGSRSGGSSEFLKRLDRNGNGMIDPDEQQGPAQFILQRMARTMPIDLSKPIPISKLTGAMEQMRSSGGFRGGSPPSSGESSSSSAKEEKQPLVAGFGTDFEFPLVPGFGEGAEFDTVQITDEDRRYASDRFRRYDRDKDGFLNKAELASGRWSDDPFQYDRNGDGKLTVDEMALRYANRRKTDEDKKKGGSKKDGPKFFVSDSGGSSASVDPRVQRMLDFTMQRYDRNKNGYLDRDEWSGMRTNPSSADRNRDNRVDKKELAKFLTSTYGNQSSSSRSGGSSSSQGRTFFSSRSGGSSSSGGDRKKADDTPAKSYRAPTASERIKEKDDLPGWFLDSDKNADAQIAMNEFASSWSDEVLADFFQFDTNKDGMITIAEALTANADGKVRGSVSTSSSSTSSSDSSSDSSKSSKSSSGGSSGPSKRYLSYAVSMIKKYDKDGDGMLDKAELAAVAILKRYKNLDANGDGKVKPDELANAMMKR